MSYNFTYLLLSTFINSLNTKFSKCVSCSNAGLPWPGSLGSQATGEHDPHPQGLLAREPRNPQNQA